MDEFRRNPAPPVNAMQKQIELCSANSCPLAPSLYTKQRLRQKICTKIPALGYSNGADPPRPETSDRHRVAKAKRR